MKVGIVNSAALAGESWAVEDLMKDPSAKIVFSPLPQETIDRLGLDVDPEHGPCPIFENEDGDLCCSYCELPYDQCRCEG